MKYKTFTPIYRCRACKEEFELYAFYRDAKPEDVNIILESMLKNELALLTIHRCANDTCGVADLVKIVFYENFSNLTRHIRRNL